MTKRIPLDIGKTKDGQISDIALAMTNDNGINMYQLFHAHHFFRLRIVTL